MSQFDHYADANDRVVLGFYGDPARFEAGPLVPGRLASTTPTAVLDRQELREGAGSVVDALTTIEYPRAVWPNPRRGDRIIMNPDVEQPDAPWQITRLYRDNGTTLVVEVAPE